MKATEIMVGDRLFYRGRFNAFDFRVEQVTNRKVGYYAEPGENRMHYLRLNEVQPIPLTPEILKRNGFITKDEQGNWKGYRIYSIFDANKRCIFMLKLYEKDSICEISLDMSPYYIVFMYVHQLQHALRLCGIGKEIVL